MKRIYAIIRHISLVRGTSHVTRDPSSTSKFHLFFCMSMLSLSLGIYIPMQMLAQSMGDIMDAMKLSPPKPRERAQILSLSSIGFWTSFMIGSKNLVEFNA